MKLYIPACGDRIVLTKAWEFDLYLEHRNVNFAKEHDLVDEKFGRWDGYDRTGDRRLKMVKAKLPAGTVLEVDRVYIRQFSKGALEVGNDFDSITFKVMKGDKPARNQRFWCKLPDCYEIDYKQEIDSRYRDRVKAVRQVMEG